MEFNHFDETGNAIMVDVSDKEETLRVAVAQGTIFMSPEAFCAIKAGTVKKGDVLGVARIAGIMAPGDLERKADFDGGDNRSGQHIIHGVHQRIDHIVMACHGEQAQLMQQVGQ